MSSLGERIRAKRQQLGWNQDELARRAGISKGFLSDLENAKRGVRAENLLDIARALGVSIDFLMQGGDERENDQEIEVPASLARFADQEGITFRQTLMLLKMQQQILAHRSASARREFWDADWRKLYDSVKEFL